MGKRLVKYIKDHPAQIKRGLLWTGILLATAVVAVVGAYYFDVATESRAFCGELCHPNGPQFVTQEISPHADVECGVCHVGPGLPAKVMAKIAGTRELYLLVTNSFERPITHPVNQLRTADVICEQCHSPGQPYEDQIERIARFADDEANTETEILMAMRIGGGDESTGAHWHIEHPVSYVSQDVDHQNIQWVGVTGDDGQLIEYNATNNPLSAEELADLPRQEMDCMTCHNRATHAFRNPADRVDEALATGDLDDQLPYLKREAVKRLSASYASQEEGISAIDDLAQFYSTEYTYAERQASVEHAVTVLQEIYRETVFPEMRITWDVYPDNLGHKDFPGCFRCHDGNLVNEQDEAISNSCTLCHSAPVVAKAGLDMTDGAVLQGLLLTNQKPDSHLAKSFAWDHRILANDTCAECHGTIEYGTDNTSFCANGVCHDQDWPEPASVASFAHPVQITGQHAQLSCNECHQGTEEPSFEDCTTCHQPPEPHFGATCIQCHNTYDWEDSAAAWLAVTSVTPHRIDPATDCASCHVDGNATSLPADHSAFPGELCTRCHGDGSTVEMVEVPHVVEGRDRCLVCHDQDGLSPVPANHQGWDVISCLLCHE